jgi:hypothetical protein
VPFVFLVWVVQAAAAGPVVVARCQVTADPQARVYELVRSGEGTGAQWTLVLHSRALTSSPVQLPLPAAKPVVTDAELKLEYRTLNGGRDVRWSVTPASAMLDVHANFELEVNVEADLDPRVDLMNTGGAIANLSCSMHPKD